MSTMVEDAVVDRFQRGLLSWAADNERAFPWRSPEADLYEVFISEMFLRRTRADVVEGVIGEFLERYPSLSALEGADREALADVIRPLGLQNKRAAALLRLTEAVEGVSLPRDRKALLELPQVGPYIANASLCFALDRQLPIVDRNVDRVYGRLLGEEWSGLDRDGRYELAGGLLPDGEARRFNLGLLDFASLVCTASDPDCEDCFARSECRYYAEVIGDTERPGGG